MAHYLYLILKFYVTLSIRFYFGKIEVYGKENIKSGGPFLFAANHQNAFMDGLLIVILNSFPVHFLIRADIFKKKWAITLLKFLKLMPVYRIRDGYSSLSKNQEQFDECIRLFVKKESVLIFPEGNHSDTRRLRELSKGFTRIAFEAQKQRPDIHLTVVPVGINYAHHKAFNKKVSVYYGKPIPVSDFYKEPLPQMANAFKNLVRQEIEKRIAHIDDDERYEEILKKLNETNPDYSDPADTNERIKKIVNGEKVERTSRRSWFYTLSTPLRPISWLINLPLLLGWGKFSKRIKDPVFTTSMKFGYGFSVGHTYYVLLMGIGCIWLGWWGLLIYPGLLFLLKTLRSPVIM